MRETTMFGGERICVCGGCGGDGGCDEWALGKTPKWGAKGVREVALRGV